ncbi:unnamed protein product [Moneuplotes crassus]|uniref:Uncharacterized protein n=1 Tax=Euplotes crassus TaxID=5936 RepID=A0AAD1Y0T9_EUPCR|nr:unnamed protein product [Moneuplotes crassus]
MGCLNFNANESPSFHLSGRLNEEGKMNLDYHRNRATHPVQSELNFTKKKRNGTENEAKRYKRIMKRVKHERNGSESSYSDLQSEYKSIYSHNDDRLSLVRENSHLQKIPRDHGDNDEIIVHEPHFGAELPKRQIVPKSKS